ncbi:MAG: hypothetical protein ACRDVZ_05595, partial [Jiangellaceae bacterium]
MELDPQDLALGAHQEAVTAGLAAWASGAIVARMWDGDPTVWSEQPVPEITDRLGWLRLHHTMRDGIPGLRALAAEVAEEGVPHVV